MPGNLNRSGSKSSPLTRKADRRSTGTQDVPSPQTQGSIEQPLSPAGTYQASVTHSHTQRAQVLPYIRLTFGSHTHQEMNEPEEGEYGWTTLMDECARIEDFLMLWNKDVDTLVVFVRDYHVALFSSNHISSLTSWSTGRLVLSGAHGVCSPSVM